MTDEAKLWECQQRTTIRARLDAGEWIDFSDAMVLFDIRRQNGLWACAELSAEGRIGSAVKLHSGIPASAWAHLRWEVVEGDFVLFASDGEQIHDVRFRVPGIKLKEPEAETPTLPAARRASLLEPADVFRRIVETQRPEGSPWTVEEYEAELDRAGLSFDPGTGRVLGVTICVSGEISRAAGAVSFHNVLLITRFRIGSPRGDFGHLSSKVEIARALRRWFDIDHSNLKSVQDKSGAQSSRDFVRTLRKYFWGNAVGVDWKPE